MKHAFEVLFTKYKIALHNLGLKLNGQSFMSALVSSLLAEQSGGNLSNICMWQV